MRAMKSYIWVALLCLAFTNACDKKEKLAEKNAEVDAAQAVDEKPAADEKAKTFAVALPSGTDMEGGKALADAITKETGVPTTARAYPDFNETLEALRDGEVQIAILDAWPYYTGHHKADLTVLAAAERGGSVEFESGWYVRADSKIDSLEDLAAKKIMFGGRDTAAGFLFATEALLDSKVIGPDDDPTKVFGEVQFAPDEAAALASLISKKTDAVSVSAPSVQALEKPESVRLLSKHGPVPTTALAIKSMTDPELKEKVRAAFVSLDAELSKKATGEPSWVAREHFEYAEALQRASEKTMAEYPLPEESD